MARLPRPLVVLDIETTGFSGHTNRLLEVAFARYEGTFSPAGRVAAHATFPCPDCEVPPFITSLTGITTADVASARPERDVLAELAVLIDGADIAAYNGRSFDVPFLRAAMARHGLDLDPVAVLDPMVVFRRQRPEPSKHGLAEAAAYYGVTPGTAHRALGDVHTTEAVLTRQLETAMSRRLESILRSPAPVFTTGEAPDVWSAVDLPYARA